MANSTYVFNNYAPTQGMELATVLTASTSATLDYDAMSDAYSEYIFVGSRLDPATDNVDLLMRVSDDGGATWESGISYRYSGIHVSSTTVTGFGSNSDTSMNMTGGLTFKMTLDLGLLILP